MSYEMRKEYKENLILMAETMENRKDVLSEKKNDSLLRDIVFSTNRNPDLIIAVCYEIFKRHGYSKEEFVERIEKEVRKELCVGEKHRYIDVIRGASSIWIPMGTFEDWRFPKSSSSEKSSERSISDSS